MPQNKNLLLNVLISLHNPHVIYADLTKQISCQKFSANCKVKLKKNPI